jgi:ABC-type phosphate transport system permease subunit
MYIDPNTGGIIFQTLALLGVCALCSVPIAIITAVVMYFRKQGKKFPPNNG